MITYLSYSLSWFGDYRSLAFLCASFGWRTFVFKETEKEKGDKNEIDNF